MKTVFRRILSAAVVLPTLLPVGSGARAEADGPDFYRLDGVAPGMNVIIRDAPDEDGAVLGEIAADTGSLVNLGCEGGPSLAEWLEMSEAERAAARDKRWCRIGHEGIEGWVPGRYLVEDGGTFAD